MSSFTQLRSKVKALESSMEANLGKYSSLASPVSSQPSNEESKIVQAIDANLSNREEAIASLSRSLDAESTQSATKLNQLQRHKEILAEHRNEYRRIKSSIQQERNRSNLLTSVRSDIESHRSRSVGPGQEQEYMLAERQRIDNTHGMADTLLAQAYETRDEFMRQRATLVNVQRRVMTAAAHIPGLNTLISKINTRKKRDSLIIAGLLTACILFLVFVR